MNKLYKKRKELNITQLQAANACGVSLRTYQTYEETDNQNSTYDELLSKLNEMGILDGSNYIVSVRFIKYIVRKIFKEQYPEIQCAFLYGSYARGEATGKSDIDILVVLDKPMGIKYFSIGETLEKELHKEVDFQSYEQLIDNPSMLKDILVEGIKIYVR
jgi:predicted nucleotidyltransferase